jgi:membrane protein YqaA with SNARE-associated domain
MIPLWLAAGLRVLLVALAHYRAITRSVFAVTLGGIITRALAAAVMETIARRKQPGEERKDNRATGRSELRPTRLRPHRNEHR